MASSARPTLLKLAIPIFIESALHALTSTVDVLMVSTISDEAVAGLTVANQFVMSAVTLFSFVAIGGSVVITHSLGGGDKAGAQQTVHTVTSVNFWMGLIISLAVALSVAPLTGVMQLSPQLQAYAQPYLFIVGATLWLVANSVSMSAILRAHGYASDAMWVTLIQNVLNAVGNAVLLFGRRHRHGIQPGSRRRYAAFLAATTHRNSAQPLAGDQTPDRRVATHPAYRPAFGWRASLLVAGVHDHHLLHGPHGSDRIGHAVLHDAHHALRVHLQFCAGFGQRDPHRVSRGCRRI